MVETLKLFKQRPFIMYLAGFAMVFCAIVLLSSYLLRKKLKHKWIIIHRAATIVILACLVFHVYAGISSMNSYSSKISTVKIDNVDLSDIDDGSYTGEYDVGYIYATVCVIVRNHEITDIKIMEHRNERGQAAEVITDEIIEQQKVRVDAISGATNSSMVIMKAVENALKDK